MPITQRGSSKKSYSTKFCKINRETSVQGSLFEKVVRLLKKVQQPAQKETTTHVFLCEFHTISSKT